MKIVFNGITFENTPNILHDNTLGLGTPPSVFVTQKTYTQDGSTYIRSNYENRKIDFEFTLIATDSADMIASKQNLYEKLNPRQGEQTMTVELYTTLYITALCDGIIPLAGNSKGNYWQTFQISFTCHDPFFWDTENSQLFTPFSGGFSFPFSFPFSLGTPAATQTLVNAGDVETPVRIVLVGPIQEAIITNTTTNESIYLTEDIDPGETVTINTQTKTVSSDVKGNVFNYISEDTTFWTLQPGNNTVTYKTSTNISGSSCTVYWKDRYTGI
jgi:hypothetical protein